MDFAGLNFLAIFVAAVAACLFGALYYRALGTAWMKAARIKPEEAKMTPPLVIAAFLAELIMAWVLAGVIGHLGLGQVTFWNGIISGAFLWLGFMATTVVVNQRYQGFGWTLSVIDAGHWLGVALIMGGIIGLSGA
ncbi:DUF1761 domain-containing protein [Nitratireductor aquimarinus]|uniref:DUF1761 domain-containing protein n=1 Tax=Nitratireductor TaxID=245876 RepID=UPI0019D38F56|nr:MULTISPECIES: DUF1761 domain-containing protein [Nitratireductor]MBN7762350.1 DUF1761 domain-containing protein [Nitratireductor aquibiodomus]MBN8244318.1 DUF1761 domain-containing protein [Nitratireductor aquimarinus]MBY6132708.1 DUF1761 domain-containing protein [Nitratireductor aquimarinus]MCA1304489.1 DUF1761 domain-containing protein [Nitratireductor aquimarinus]MCV0352373.1 DUF1761 domain-containing protein [Nitratireductor sp.]